MIAVAVRIRLRASSIIVLGLAVAGLAMATSVPALAATPPVLVTLTENGSALYVSGTTLYVGAATAGETFRATFDATGLVGVASIDCAVLDGFTVAADVPDTRCTYTATGPGYPIGPAVSTLRDGGGAALATGTFPVIHDLEDPRVDFSTPDGGIALTDSSSVDVIWTPRDNASGVATWSLRHFVSGLVSGGSCGPDWIEVGDPTSAASPVHVTGLADQRCHRWRLDLVDNVGIKGSGTSGSLWVDRTGPLARPRLSVVSGAMALDPDPDRYFVLWVGTPAEGAQFKVRYDDTRPGWEMGSATCPTVPGFTAPDTATADPAHTPVVCTYTATGSGYAEGDFTGDATDEVGQAGTTMRFHVTRDTTAPDVQFTEPAPGLIPTKDERVKLDWLMTDAGVGIDWDALQRQSAPQVNAGDCADTVWDDEGFATTPSRPSYPGALVDGMCYRWILTADDKVKNHGRDVAGPFLADRTNPTATTTLASSSPHIAVAQDVVRLSAPAAGETFAAHVVAADGGSGIGEIGCPAIPGFEVDRSGSGPDITCTWSATGSGYLSGRRTIHVPDRAGNEIPQTLQVISPEPALSPLPRSWTNKDIGAVGKPGAGGQIQEADLYFTKGAGTGFSGAADSFHWIGWKIWSNRLQLHLVDQAAPNAKAIVGLMVRQNVKPGARFVFIGRRADGAIVAIRRTAVGKPAVTTVVARGSVSVPILLQIKRAGDTYTLEARPGGSGAWTKAVKVTLDLPSSASAGIAITSRTPSAPSTAVWR